MFTNFTSKVIKRFTLFWTDVMRPESPLLPTGVLVLENHLKLKFSQMFGYIACFSSFVDIWFVGFTLWDLLELCFSGHLQLILLAKLPSPIKEQVFFKDTSCSYLSATLNPSLCQLPNSHFIEHLQIHLVVPTIFCYLHTIDLKKC